MSDELVQEWVAKAEEDWAALERLLTGQLASVANVVSFHCQQCGEKYLNALIQKQGGEPPRIHQLPALLDVLAHSSPELEGLRRPCEGLSPYAVEFRYPGVFASEDDARDALSYAEAIRSAAREVLGLPAE